MHYSVARNPAAPIPGATKRGPRYISGNVYKIWPNIFMTSNIAYKYNFSIQKEWRYKFRAGRTFLTLTKFVEKIFKILAIFAVGHRENNKLAATHRQHLLLLSTIMKSRMFASGHRLH